MKIKLVLVLLVLLAPLPPHSSSQEPAEPPPVSAPQMVSGPTPPLDAAEEEALLDEFVPSEQVSFDKTISFPVDI